jgi:hypothetical protein
MPEEKQLRETPIFIALQVSGLKPLRGIGNRRRRNQSVDELKPLLKSYLSMYYIVASEGFSDASQTDGPRLWVVGL